MSSEVLVHHTLAKKLKQQYGTGIICRLPCLKLFLTCCYPGTVRLRDRLLKIELGDAGFKIDKNLATIAQICIAKLENPKKSTLGIKAYEHYNLMMVRQMYLCVTFLIFINNFFCKYVGTSVRAPKSTGPRD